MATDDDDNKDPKVKALVERGERPLDEVVDPETAAQLERWFGLPSYAQVEAGEVETPIEDSGVTEARERRQKAIAAVDPSLVDAIQRRAEPREDIIQFTGDFTSRVHENLSAFDVAMVDSFGQLHEPREYACPEDITEELGQNHVPQALLRDLHRLEWEFYKGLEVVDMAAEQKVDGSAIVAQVMATRWDATGTLVGNPWTFWTELRAERALPWKDLPTRVHLPNRTVTE